MVPVGDEDGVSLVNDHHERRFTEYRLEAGEELSINGQTRAAPNSVETDGNPSVTITDGDSTAVYSISTDPDRDVSNQLLQQAATPIVIGSVLFVGGLAWAFVV